MDATRMTIFNMHGRNTGLHRLNLSSLKSVWRMSALGASRHSFIDFDPLTVSADSTLAQRQDYRYLASKGARG